MKTLSNQQLSIQVSEHGAELCSIKCNNREYLWQADPVTSTSYTLFGSFR